MAPPICMLERPGLALLLRPRALTLLVVVLFVVALAVRIGSAATGPTYDPQVAKEQLLFSYAAYCPSAEVLSWNCYWCKQQSLMSKFQLTNILWNGTSNTFGYVGYDSNQRSIVIAFRGTESESLSNWITDLSAGKLQPFAPVPGALVHGGFLNAFLKVKPQVLDSLQRVLSICPNCNHLRITGHSLGAALATLCVVDADVRNLFSKAHHADAHVSVYDFGSPRVGNQVFSSLYTSSVEETWRMVNERDIVPHLPPREMGFIHVTTEVWAHKNGSYEICSGTNSEDPSCSDSLFIPLSVPDHLSYMNLNLDTGGC